MSNEQVDYLQTVIESMRSEIAMENSTRPTPPKIDKNAKQHLGTQPNDDIRLEGQVGAKGRKILFGSIMIKDTHTQWSPHSTEQPDWVQGILNRNTEILRSFGHKMILRLATGPVPLTKWQFSSCTNTSKDEVQCVSENQREDANWEKEEMMSKYLNEPGITHVMILDADAVLMQTHLDTLNELADLLDESGKDMLFTDEDWHVNGTHRVNGGLLFAKVTDFTKEYYGGLVQAHREGPWYTPQFGCGKCSSNEQLCIQGWMNCNFLNITDRFLWASGIKYNFHPQVWLNSVGRYPITPSTANRSLFDPTLEVLHFMGASKGVAPQLLAQLQGDFPLESLQSSDKDLSLVVMEERTCNDGKGEIECFDVERCASDAPDNGKYAFVLTNDLSKPLSLPLPNLESMSYIARKHKMDIIMLVPKKDAARNATNFITASQKKTLEDAGVKLMQVPWLLPPQMRHVPVNEHWGPKHFIRLHALALLGYDAVAFYEDDIEIQQDVMPALKCASKGYFLATSGPLAPLNAGFFAVKPSKELMQAAMLFAREAPFDDETGWDGAGFLPHTDKYSSAELLPGFLHTFMYKQSPSAERAMRKAGAKIEARQLDYCTWNYQGRCPTANFNCASIRANHHGGGAGCWKYGVALHTYDVDYI